MALSDEDLQMKPFRKDQSSQCSLNQFSTLRRTSSVNDIAPTTDKHQHYVFHEMGIKKPSGARPSLGLTFDKNGHRPPVLRQIDATGCFANVQEISKGDRLLYVDNILYGNGNHLLSDIKQHFINTEEGTVMNMCWLRRTDGIKGSACCSQKCLAIRERIDEVNHLLQKTKRDAQLEESHEKTELLRVQNLLSESLKTAHVAVTSLSGEVESLKEASHLLQNECEQQVTELRSKLADKQAELDTLTMHVGEIDSRVHASVPLDIIPTDVQQFRIFFQQHRELYRRYLLEAINENAKLQSQCAAREGELNKANSSHATELQAKDAEIQQLKMELEKEREMSKGAISQLDELYVRNLALDDELRQKNSEINSLAQTQEQIARIGSHDEVIDDWRRKCQSYETQLSEAKNVVKTLQVQNSSLKVQLKSNEQSLHELRETMLSDSGYVDRLSSSEGSSNNASPESQS